MKKTIITLTETFLISILLCVIILLFIAQSLTISGTSMLPTLQNGQKIVVEKVSYKTSEPKHGDIIVFRDSKNNSHFLIKRIIGVPGDTVTITNNVIEVDNKIVSEPYTLNGNHFDNLSKLQPILGIPIPNEKYLVMGDNRDESYDSRNFGLVDKSSIVGKALVIFWPISDFSKL